MHEWKFPNPGDKDRMWAAVAELPCQAPTVPGGMRDICGRYGVQVSHSNQERDGKGGGLKARPWMVAAICPGCHVEIDSGPSLSREDRRSMWDTAHRNSISALFARGRLRPVGLNRGEVK